jgi:hypothetical protein
MYVFASILLVNQLLSNDLAPDVVFFPGTNGCINGTSCIQITFKPTSFLSSRVCHYLWMDSRITPDTSILINNEDGCRNNHTMPATSRTMQSPCVEWQLSDFCKERDQSGLPVFADEVKVVFPDDAPSPEDIQQAEEWNCLNKHLLSAIMSIRDNEQAI